MKNKLAVFVGTYTCPIKFGTGKILEGKGEGIYLLELDMAAGSLSRLHTTTDVVNPSYLVLSGDRKHLYCVNELKEFEGRASGAVSAFSVSDDGQLRFINQQATGGTDPCHIELSPEGKHLYASNFMSGSVCAFNIRDDGSISAASQFIQHEGSSVNPNRQAGPHAHSLTFTPDRRYGLVPDLGIDRLMVYAYDAETGALQPTAAPFFSTRPGAGPRHCTFEPGGRYCYLINELDSTIAVLEYSSEKGTFSQLQTVSSLPEGVQVPGNTCADVHITPDGSFLYGSNRGHDSIIAYRIDKQAGLLSYAGCQPCGGKTPRNFAIEPTGKYLLCANQDSDAIAVFEISPQTGALSQKSTFDLPTPVCVRPYIF